MLVATLLLWTLSACSVLVGPAEPSQRVGLRFLLLGDGTDASAMRAWQGALRTEGVPFDVVVPSRDPLSREDLVPAPGHARFQAVVQASDVGPLDLPADQQALIDAYLDEFGLREVVAFGAPPGTVPGAMRDLNGLPLQVTEEGEQWWPALSGEVPVAGAFGYLPSASAQMEALVTDAGGSPVIAAAQVGGHEELYVAVQTAPELLHFRLLSHGLVNWASGGVHLGLRRFYLAAQVDDVLLPNFRWDVAANETKFGGDDVILMTVEDVHATAEWSRRQDFRIDMVVNLGGTGVQDLLDPLLEHEETFGWVSHTYTHLDLDEATLEEIDEQIEENLVCAERVDLEYDSPHELVTGEHSGLDNPALVPAMEEHDIRYVASDASRRPDPYLLGSTLTVPRHPVNLYYDVGTREEQLDQYNHTYFETCTGEFCLDRPIGWDEYLDTLSRQILEFVYANDPRTLYVHQSNLAEDRLLLVVLDEVLARYRATVDFPLVQPTLTESGQAIVRQREWTEAIEQDAFDAYLEDGNLVVEPQRELAVPVTGVGEETYGEERSGWVTVEEGERLSLPLP